MDNKKRNKFDVSLTQEQQRCLVNSLQSGLNMLIIGRIGMGKTELLTWLLERVDGKIPVCVVETRKEVSSRYAGENRCNKPFWLTQALGYRETEGLYHETYNCLFYDEVRGISNLKEVTESIARGIQVVATMNGRPNCEHLNLLRKSFQGLVAYNFDVVIGLEEDSFGNVEVTIQENGPQCKRVIVNNVNKNRTRNRA